LQRQRLGFDLVQCWPQPGTCQHTVRRGVDARRRRAIRIVVRILERRLRDGRRVRYRPPDALQQNLHGQSGIVKAMT
jgi:hypothetical protein